MSNARVFTVYKAATGEILASGSCPEELLNLHGDEAQGEALLLGINAPGDEFYVLDGQVVARPAMTLTAPEAGLVGEPVVITGIPAGTRIHYHDGEAVMDESGVLEWESAVAGSFVFYLDAFPHRSQEVRIEIT